MNARGRASSEVKRLAGRSLPPQTTAQEDITFAGQRKVNLIWEVTQAAIALMIVLTIVLVAVLQREIPDILSNCGFLVLGFYFSRTNHSAIGGVGAKPTQPYMGR